MKEKADVGLLTVLAIRGAMPATVTLIIRTPNQRADRVSVETSTRQ